MDDPELSGRAAPRSTAVACDDLEFALPDEIVRAASVSGRASWDAPYCAIGVDLVVEFEDGTVEVLRAEGIETGWGGCG